MKLGSLTIAAALLAAPLSAGEAQTSPYGNPMQLFGLAGFQVIKNRPANRCGTPANPGVTMLDMNGDAQKNEALIVDAGPCYAPDNVFFALAARTAPGQPWRLLYSHTGKVRAITTATQGWRDLEYTSAGKVVPLRYTGNVYAPVGAAPVKAGAPAAPAAAPAPVAPSAALLSPSTKPAALTPAQRTAIFKATSAVKKGAKWIICTDDPDAEGISVDSVQDLNGDGRAEAVVIEGGTYCYGNTGAYFALVGQQPDGSWKQIEADTGIATFLKTKTLGWPDLEIGGPGFCFPVSRWSGKQYVFHHFNEYMKGMCAQNGLKPAVRAY